LGIALVELFCQLEIISSIFEFAQNPSDSLSNIVKTRVRHMLQAEDLFGQSADKIGCVGRLCEMVFKQAKVASEHVDAFLEVGVSVKGLQFFSQDPEQLV
jgi:hypothetical protein